MNRKLNAFSLAEVLISLLIIGIALSATIPTVTKRTSVDRDTIWQWAQDGNTLFFGVGGPQRVSLGGDSIQDSKVSGSQATDSGFDSKNSKLSIFKEGVAINGSSGKINNHMASSHIAFYTKDAINTSAKPKYAGRLALDDTNIALGKGTLINLTEAKNNIAIGPDALMKNQTNSGNIAIGNSALKNSEYTNDSSNFGDNIAIGNETLQNTKGTDNIAIGRKALQNDDNGVQNIAIGALSLQNIKGSLYNLNNIAIGHLAMANANGSDISDNIAIGENTLRYVKNKATNNVIIGHNACSSAAKKDIQLFNTICIGSNLDPMGTTPSVTEYDNSLYIGGGMGDKIPLIEARLTKGKEHGDGGASIVSEYSRLFRLKLGDDANIPLNFHAKSDENKVLIDSTRSGINPFNQKSTDGQAAIAIGQNSLHRLELDKDKFSLKLNEDDEEQVSIGKNPDTKFRMEDNGNITISTAHRGGFEPNISINTGLSQLYMNKNGGVVLSANEGTPNETKLTVGTNGVVTLRAASQFGVFTNNEPEISVFFDGGDVHIQNPIKGETPGGSGVGANIKRLWSDKQDKYVSSDLRLKNVSGDSTAGLAEINKLEVKNFTYKKDEKKTPHVGVIAQQLQKVFPNSVIKGEDGYLRIKREEIFYAMVNSIKELFAKFQDLTAKVTGLDKRINELEAQNKMLIEQNKKFEERLNKLEKATK